MPEIASAWVTLVATTKGMERDIAAAIDRSTRGAKIDPQVDYGKVGRSGSEAGRLFGSRLSSAAASGTNLSAVEQKLVDVGHRGAEKMGKALKVGIAGAAASAAGVLATSLKLGFDRLTAIDEAKSKLQGLGHDAATTARIMDSALASVKGTAYGLGDAATIAANAVAAGVKPGQELTSYLKMTADAAAIAGTGLGDMGRIINQVRTGQKAYTDDLNQLADRGIPIYQWIAEAAGVAAGNVKEMAANGNISAQVFEQAITDHIGGAAKKMGDSFKGARDNLKAALGRDGAAILEPFFNRLKGGFGSATVALDAFTPKLTEMAKAFDAKVFDEWAPKVKHAFEQLKSNKAIGDDWSRVSAMFNSLAGTAERLWPSLVQIGSALGKASVALGVSSWSIFLTTLEAAAGVLNSIAPLIQGLGGFMSKHQGIVTAAAAAWLLFRTVPGIMRGISTAVAPVQSAVRTLAGHQGPLTGVRAQLTAIAGDYRNLGAAAQRNGQHLSAFSRIMTAATNNSTPLRNMSNAFMGASSTAGGFAAALRTGVAPAMGALKGAASGLIGALGGPFGAALAAAGIAFTLIASKNQQAEQSMEAYQNAVKRTRSAQVDLNEALMRSRGAYDDDTRAAGTTRIGALMDELDTASEKTGSFLDMYRKAGEHSIWSAVKGFASHYDTDLNQQRAGGGTEDGRLRAEAAAAGQAKAALDALKVSNQTLADVTYGSQAAFDALVGKLDAAGEGGKKAADAMRQARTEFLAQQAAAQRTAPGIKQMSDAMRVLSDSTATAADKARALTSALDALNPERGVLAAESAHTQVMERIAEAAKEATDATGGMGDALFKANGALNGAVPNGAALGQSLLSIVDATQQLAAAGDSDAFMKGQQANEAAFAALAQKYGASIAQIKAAADSLGYSDIELVLNLAGADETTQALGAIKKAFDAQPDKKTIEFPTDSIEGAKKKLEELGVKVEDVPDTHTTKITLDDGNSQAILAEIKQALDAIQDKNVSVKINQIATAQNIPQNVVDNSWWGPAAQPRLVGAIVPMADGGFRYMRKPETAGLYAGRGLGTIFAEKDTGGEAYIPLAAGKRQRSRAILTEVARLFGMQVMEDGGITIESLKQYASQVSGRGYVRGGGNGDTFDSDCSGVQATISNYVTGASGRFSTQNEGAALLARGFQQGDPPAGVAAYWIGWQNGGPGGGHTAGTIVDPYGGNVNVEMGGAAGGGQYGGGTGASAFPNRAWIAVGGGEDPRSGSGGGSTAAVRSAQASVTSSKAAVTSAQTALKDAEAKISELKAKGASSDKIDSAEKKRDAAQQRLTAAEQRQDSAETRLAEVKEKAASTAEKGSSGGGDASSLGQSLINGLFSGIGLDGSVFADFREWPNFKSLMAGLNWGGGFLKTILGGQGDGSDDGTGITSSGGGMGIGGLQLPGIADFLKPIGGDQYTTPIAAGPHPGSGAAPGPTAPQGPQVVNNFNGNLGVNPTEFHQKTQAKQNQAVNRNLGAVRPR